MMALTISVQYCSPLTLGRCTNTCRRLCCFYLFVPVPPNAKARLVIPQKQRRQHTRSSSNFSLSSLVRLPSDIICFRLPLVVVTVRRAWPSVYLPKSLYVYRAQRDTSTASSSADGNSINTTQNCIRKRTKENRLVILSVVSLVVYKRRCICCWRRYSLCSENNGVK